MKKITFALLIPALFAGCATSFETLNVALPKLHGKTINVAINYLGIPAREYSIAGNKVYEWTTVGPNPFSPASQNLSCTIKLSTSNDVVRGYDYDGSNGTCQVYADRLKPLL